MSAIATVDLGAIRHNVAAIASESATTAICAVVKANGYGHGALPVAEAALASGAKALAVATLNEVVELAEGGIDGDVPVLLLSEPAAADLAAASPSLPDGIRFTIASSAGLAEICALPGGPRRVHLQVDTGMHRMGVDPAETVTLARAIAAAANTQLEGVWTHFASADEPTNPFTSVQIERFDAAIATLTEAGIDPGIIHLANSAGAIAHPDARRDLVRLGIAMYGIAPSRLLEGMVDLRPALRLSAPVTAVRTVDVGESVSYGRRWFAGEPTRVATVGIGYADGIRRASPTAGVEVLVRGCRAPMLGTVTMDQLMIAVADDVDVGDEVVLIGGQGDDEITANEIASRLGTIGYEVVLAIGPRVQRHYLG